VPHGAGPHIVIRRGSDGSFTYTVEEPFHTSVLSGGWRQVAELRERHAVVEWFPVSEDYRAFCATFGEPPGVGERILGSGEDSGE
jgi:hypothetical protein